MADSEFEEFRRVFDKLPQHIKAPTPFYSLVPNVGFEDISPSSKSEGSPEDDRHSVGDIDGATSLPTEIISDLPRPEQADLHRSPRHQNFSTGERRRRKLPEIPKNRKSIIIPVGQPTSLADELSTQSGLFIRPAYQTRPLLVLKCGYLLDEDSSPDSERLQSLGDVDSGHSTAHSPVDTGPKSLSPTQLQQNVSPTSSCSISGINLAGNMTTVPHSQLEMLEATHRGLHKFNPRHHDEIEVEIGDPIYVQKEADDLWCEGVNLRTGQQGIFPSAYAVDMDYNDFDPANAKVKRERYLLGYLGSVETLAHKGTGVVCQAVKKIVGDNTSEPTTQACILEVSDQGLRMVDRSKPNMVQLNDRFLDRFTYYHTLMTRVFVSAPARITNLRMTPLIASDKDPNIARNRLQSDFDVLARWCHDAGLVLNSMKTKLMVVKSPYLKENAAIGILRNQSTACIDYFYSLKNVSFCAFHPRDHRFLGFITKHPTLQRFACHVFRGQESTRPVAEAVGRAFQRFYQKFIETAYPIEDIYIE